MNDLDTIKQLEKILQIELGELEEIDWDSRGYTINQNGQATGFGFNNCKIEKP